LNIFTAVITTSSLIVTGAVIFSFFHRAGNDFLSYRYWRGDFLFFSPRQLQLPLMSLPAR